MRHTRKPADPHRVSPDRLTSLEPVAKRGGQNRTKSVLLSGMSILDRHRRSSVGSARYTEDDMEKGTITKMNPDGTTTSSVLGMVQEVSYQDNSAYPPTSPSAASNGAKTLVAGERAVRSPGGATEGTSTVYSPAPAYSTALHENEDWPPAAAMNPARAGTDGWVTWSLSCLTRGVY